MINLCGSEVLDNCVGCQSANSIISNKYTISFEEFPATTKFGGSSTRSCTTCTEIIHIVELGTPLNEDAKDEALQ